jgi:hypothetical protein
MEVETIIALVAIPLFGWLLLQAVQSRTKIAVLAKGQESIMSAISDTNDSVDSLKTDFGKLEQKINIFLKTEIDSFKDITRENTEALKQIAKK